MLQVLYGRTKHPACGDECSAERIRHKSPSTWCRGSDRDRVTAPLDEEGTAIACAVHDVDYKGLMSVRRAVQQGSKRCSGLLPGHLTGTQQAESPRARASQLQDRRRPQRGCLQCGGCRLLQRLLRKLGQWLAGLGSLGTGGSVFYHLPLLLPLLTQLALLLLQAGEREGGSAGGSVGAASLARHHFDAAGAAGELRKQVRQQMGAPVLTPHCPQQQPKPSAQEGRGPAGQPQAAIRGSLIRGEQVCVQACCHHTLSSAATARSLFGAALSPSQ